MPSVEHVLAAVSAHSASGSVPDVTGAHLPSAWPVRTMAQA
jgi:hypothetical protein